MGKQKADGNFIYHKGYILGSNSELGEYSHQWVVTSFCERCKRLGFLIEPA